MTISKRITKGEELVVVSRKEYDDLLRFRNKKEREIVTENDVLRWSQEAKRLKKIGKLAIFKNFAKSEYSDIARKYGI